MLEIRTLGGLEIRLGGRPIDGVLAPKSAALLCYLAVTTHGRSGRPHSRAALAGLLWGEATEVNGRSYLRQALAELRRRASLHLTITRSTVAFDAASPHWLDVAAFECRIFPADPKAFTPPDLSALEEAVDSYHGDFLAGFYVRRAPAFEEWVLLERERLRLEALRALHALIGHFSARGQHARAVDYAARLLALEPADEGVQRQMMSLLAQSGRQAAALHQYEICRQVLHDVLGMEPHAETVALFERIRAGQAVGGASLIRIKLRHKLTDVWRRSPKRRQVRPKPKRDRHWVACSVSL